jgi:FkbM family methyltransferase
LGFQLLNVLKNHVEIFVSKVHTILDMHGLSSDSDFCFSEEALANASNKNWNLAAKELKANIELTLHGMLSDMHKFVDEPYVRRIELPTGGVMFVSIINEQSREWYGGENTLAAFDFVHEFQLGIFSNCKRYLDLGGHQLIWSIFYAQTYDDASVIAFEPSILNVLIGLFNCLVNGVIDRVQVAPFAVASKNVVISSSDSEKMLVDFMTVPIRTCEIGKYANGVFDFIKIDIEGYEFEMLGDADFCNLVRHAKKTHFELHLGHLVKRSIYVEHCVDSLKKLGVSGSELYSGVEMYRFLASCKRDGFFSFVISP